MGLARLPISSDLKHDTGISGRESSCEKQKKRCTTQSCWHSKKDFLVMEEVNSESASATSDGACNWWMGSTLIAVGQHHFLAVPAVCVESGHGLHLVPCAPPAVGVQIKAEQMST